MDGRCHYDSRIRSKPKWFQHNATADVHVSIMNTGILQIPKSPRSCMQTDLAFPMGADMQLEVACHLHAAVSSVPCARRLTAAYQRRSVRTPPRHSAVDSSASVLNMIKMNEASPLAVSGAADADDGLAFVSATAVASNGLTSWKLAHLGAALGFPESTEAPERAPTSATAAQRCKPQCPGRASRCTPVPCTGMASIDTTLPCASLSDSRLSAQWRLP